MVVLRSSEYPNIRRRNASTDWAGAYRRIRNGHDRFRIRNRITPICFSILAKCLLLSVLWNAKLLD